MRRRAAGSAGGYHRQRRGRPARDRGLRVNRAVVAAVAVMLVIGGLVAVLAPLSFGSGQAAPQAATLKSQDAELAAMPAGSVEGGFSSLAAGGRIAQFQMGAHATVRVKVAGKEGVPVSGAGAVALSVHVTGAASGSITVWAQGTRQPDVPSLRWTGHAPASGLAVSALGGGGVTVGCSASGPVTVTFYVAGYWLSGTAEAAGSFSPLAAAAVTHLTVAAGAAVPVQVAGRAGVPGSGVGAVALSVDAAGRAAGSVNLYAAGAAPPQVPAVSWSAHAPGSGLVLSAVGTGGQVTVLNDSPSPVTVALDAVGYWLSGSAAAVGTFEPLDGAVVAHQQVGAHATALVQVAGAAGVPASGAGAAALSVEASGAAPGSLEVWAARGPDPAAPVLFWAAHSVASGLDVTPLGSSGQVAVRNDSSRPVTVTLAASGYWLSAARTVSSVAPKPTTTVLAAGDVTAVSGDADATQAVTLAPGAVVPSVGHVLVAPPSAAAPDGLLGTVTAVTAGPGGATVVTLTPATLDQAYSAFDVSTSQTLTSSDVQITGSQDGTPASGQADAVAAAPLSAGAPTASSAQPARLTADDAPSFGYDLNDAAFTCTGSAGPQIALTADLSNMSVDLSLNADPTAPNIHFLVTADPVFDINVGFTGTMDCKLSDDKFLTATIPVPGAPELDVTFSPYIELTADGQASIDFTWSPRAALGFDKGPGINSETHGFGSSSSVGISASADADLFLGFDLEISLAGRIGVGGDFGPDLPATYTSSTGCVTVNGQLKADLTADANDFVQDWSFTLASGTFDESQLYQKCGATSTSTSTSTAAPGLVLPAVLPDGTAGQSYSGAVTASGGDAPYTVTLSAGSLPVGLSISSDGTISGTPQSAGSSTFTVTVTDSAGATATGTYTITVAANVGTGTAWTAAEAPLPAGLSDPYLDSVSCMSASQCVAVGYAGDTSGTVGLVLTESGGSWTGSEAPLPASLPAGTWVYMMRVSCVSASQCVAVGYAQVDGTGTVGVLWTDSGGSWTAAEAPLPAGADGGADAYSPLYGVSCVSASQCVAVGGVDVSGADQGLVLTDSGGSWTAAVAPWQQNTGVAIQDLDLRGVSCWSASQCIVVGDGEDVLTDSGGSWTAAAAPVPADDLGTSDLYGVSCVSASQCIAVGSAPVSGITQTQLLTDSGGSWTAAVAPQPAGASRAGGSTIADVSCWSASQCIAVGGTVLTDSGGSWTAAEAPLPAGASDGGPDSVSCWSASQCVAVGNYTDTSGSNQGLILTLG